MMEQPDIEEIIRQSPHLDRPELENAREAYRKLRRRGSKARYRLAPVGQRRIHVGEGDRRDSRTVYIGW